MEVKRFQPRAERRLQQPIGILRETGIHTHIYTFTKANHAALLRTLGIHAADPTQPLTWGDAASLIMSAWEKAHNRRFPRNTGAA